MKKWTLNSWRDYPVKHIPKYEDEKELAMVLKKVSSFPPLVFAGETRALKKSLGQVAEGKAFLLQGGDCAESFAEFHPDNIRDTFKVILQMALVLTFSASLPVVKIGRIAGQFSKPRSSPVEIKNGKEYNVSYWSTAKGEAHKKRLMDKAKAQLPNKHKWLPDVIASHNPSIVTVDEAHEGFKNIKHKGSSVRANAIKTIAKKPEYFIPATGTVLRNDIGELAGMLHVTNPEEFPNPTKWTNKYESTNQGNTVFQEQAVEGFRQSLDCLLYTSPSPRD